METTRRYRKSRSRGKHFAGGLAAILVISTFPHERYFVKDDSKGDIVAGKNIW